MDEEDKVLKQISRDAELMLIFAVVDIDMMYIQKYAPHCSLISGEVDCINYGCSEWAWLHRN